MRNIIVYIIILSLTLAACEKFHFPEENEWDEGVVYFTGDIAVDGCGWLLLSEGKSYHLSDLPKRYQVDGLDVWFKANTLAETFKCGLAQEQFQIKEMLNITEKPWMVRFLNDYPGRETSLDGFSMDSAFIDGDSLRLHVGYSGGCAIHQFNLWALENGQEEDLHLMLEHIGNGDPCEAYPWEWLSFSLKPLRIPGQNEVSFHLRGSPIMSSLFGYYTYKY